MARLIVFMVDNTDPKDIYRDAKLYKRGDVIDVLPDGLSPGKAVENNPKFQIIDCPAMTMSEAEAFLAPEPGYAGKSDSLKRRRAYKVDIDNAVLSKANPLAVSRTLLNSVKVEKVPLVDPFVLGDSADEKVLG